ncbi:hypothetical protein QYE76_065231 [Lolium multiflorum]|uniref:Uncharacterized protein n=1 Tax=Lolium multiflorum TaxID=4521 RepID=A0AAD8S9P5_LOLMU|nr:hypothetical protein QYE76_065231 [Lolium multiflorum]
MQTVLVNIPFATSKPSWTQPYGWKESCMANENRKRRMMNQSGPHHTRSTAITPPEDSLQKQQATCSDLPPQLQNNNNGNNPNTNTPEDWKQCHPVTPKDKSTVNCYEVVGHYSKECPKKLAKIAANTAAPASNSPSQVEGTEQQQRPFLPHGCH